MIIIKRFTFGKLGANVLPSNSSLDDRSDNFLVLQFKNNK